MTNHWEALGWTLVHFLWEGTLIALVYRILDLALTRRSATVRYGLALAALLSMAAVSLTTLAYEEASMDLPATHVAGAIHTVISTAQPFETTFTDSAALAPLHDGHRFLTTRLMPWLDGLWLAGVLLLSGRALGGWWFMQRLSRRTLEVAPHTLRLRLDVLRRNMGIPRFVDLRLSRKIASPLTAGVLRPWILLPITALTTLSPEQLEVVLCHELAHIRRADYFWNLLQTAIETLFFFHPAVWWISRRVREERELCCDDVAVEFCTDPAVYATALLRLEEERKSQLRLAMALDGHQSRASLRARILRILGEVEERSSRVRPVSLAAMAVGALLFICPVTKVFASFRAVPSVASSVAPVVRKAISPVLRAVRAIPAAIQEQAAKPSDAQPAPPPQQSANEPEQDHAYPASSSYIDQMRAAGYDVDIDKYVAMKIQGITPEYAAEMAKALGSHVVADQLIAMKVQDVTPEYLSRMRAAGYNVDANQYIAMKVQDITPAYAAAIAKAVGSELSASRLIAMKVQDITPESIAQMRADGYDASPDRYIAMKVQGITPDYANAMAKLGYGKPTVDELIAMKVQGVTPEWAEKLHASGIQTSSFRDLISDRIFQVTPEFVAGMKAAGFDAIPPKKLIELRVQGVTPDFAKSVRARFPDATLQDLVQMRVFHIDADFIASAQKHGFAPLTIQKLVKLRISGILDDVHSAKENQP
ncbi:MAG TPA: M56 family metallopeptidase [Acidobacteriaceae bacterium]|jgi:beta-lactamase regulating signal transducer with metallopeptidase domain|nr:M56 family metallopeptidase [Acidobacteriaceae bacterium]